MACPKNSLIVRNLKVLINHSMEQNLEKFQTVSRYPLFSVAKILVTILAIPNIIRSNTQ